VLAILLLHPNEVVSTARLVDLLWGDDPPDDAATALHQHVSRLRRVFGSHDPIETRAPGYVLRVEDDQLDRARFERLAAGGRERLEAGDPAGAAELLREALSLWRGRPLADLEDEQFVRDATAHLDEARGTALESRIDADLALGREAELVPELRELVRAEPLRERFRAQLMLALYRSGRQAEALDAYADARRTLVDEVGLEPGPELQRLQAAVLAQDPALERSRATGTSAGARSRRRHVLLAAVVATVVLAAVALLVAAVRSDDTSPAAAVTGGAVAVVDPASGKVRERLPVGSTPSAVAAGADGVWVIDADDRTVTRIDPKTHETATFATGSTPTDIAAGDDGVWVGDGEQLAAAQFIGPVATAVSRVDPATRTVRARVGLPASGAGAVSNLVDDHLAAVAGGVWAITAESALVRIDATTDAITARRPARPLAAAAIAAGDGELWLLSLNGTVARLDPRTGVPTGSVRLDLGDGGALAVGGGSAWVISPGTGTLWRVESGPRLTPTAIPVGEGATDVAYGAGAAWLVNPVSGQLARVDPETNAIGRRIAIGGIPRAVAASDDGVWVSVADSGSPATGASAGVRAMPSSSCGPVFAGPRGDGKRLLIVSDLPLQGGVRISAPQMAQAIAFVLRRHGFRAGPFEVAYQSCDDSVGRTGLPDDAKCAANARAYGRNPAVVGVIGTLNSGCALDALPLLNRSPGPLAMISPSNSYVGLTRAGPGTPPGGLNQLYPTGRRNYLRVFPTDDLQGAALAQWLAGKGARRVFVLDDGQPGYGELHSLAFDRAARRAGLRVVGAARWDQHAKSYDQLAARVAAARPDAVFLGGLIDSNGPLVVRDLRRRLGRKPLLVAPDGFTPVSALLARGGPAARDTYISIGGLTNASFGPAARRFERAFGATQPGVPVEPSAIYAAQAAEVLLDAIARSDGTRASVLRALFATKLQGSLIGDVSFDRNGDVEESPITIVRAVRPGGSTRIQSIEGATVQGLVRPSLDLVR